MSPYKPVLQEFVDLFYDCVSASNLIGIYPQTCHLWKPQLMLSVGPLRALKTRGIQKKGRKRTGNGEEAAGKAERVKKKVNLRGRMQENEED